MAAQFPAGPRDGMFGLRTMARMKSDVLGVYSQLHRDYGDSVSFPTGPFRLFIFYHPDQVRELLVTQGKSFIRFARVMDTFAQWNGNSILIAEGDDWIRQRRLVQPAFHPHRMEGYSETIVGCVKQMIEDWEVDVDQSGHVEVDVDSAMTSLTLRIICKALFDTDVQDSADELSQAVGTLSRVAFHEMQATIRYPLWLPTQFNRRKREAMRVLDENVWRIVRERRADGADHGDLLSMLLASVDDEAGQLTDEQVRDEATTLMLAGHDTTASALDWVWINLARHGDVAAQCREEIDEVLGGRDPTFADVADLKFVEATIKETLRLYPPAISVFLRQAKENLTIGGFDIPKNSLVTLSSFVTHRDPRWFQAPERFEPERFLPPRVDDIRPGAYFPFGAGPRVCIGQAFAMTEMVLVVAMLLQRFNVASTNGGKEPGMEVQMSLRPKEKVVLRWTRRERASIPASG